MDVSQGITRDPGAEQVHLKGIEEERMQRENLFQRRGRKSVTWNKNNISRDYRVQYMR